jgi:D-glycero-alpha-D-manno-heptose 1-phosphate guanylyltransferase
MSPLPALILAGGLGARLRGVLDDRPKVLAPVAGRPFLSYLLDQLQDSGIHEAILCTGHRAAQIRAEFGSRYGDLELTYSEESTPLGTGGAVRHALAGTDASEMLVLNGDSYVAAKLTEFLRWRNDFAGSLLLTWVEDAARFGTVKFGDEGGIRAFLEKRGLPQPGWINAGIYRLSRRLIEQLPADRPVSFESEAFPAWLAQGLGAYPVHAPFLDIGTPQSLAQAESFLAGVTAS